MYIAYYCSTFSITLYYSNTNLPSSLLIYLPIQLRIKQELVNDEMRTKSTVLALADIDYVAENQKLLDAIAKYQ